MYSTNLISLTCNVDRLESNTNESLEGSLAFSELMKFVLLAFLKGFLKEGHKKKSLAWRSKFALMALSETNPFEALLDFLFHQDPRGWSSTYAEEM